jgi:NADH-quinone oxidoreductase subunit F
MTENHEGVVNMADIDAIVAEHGQAADAVIPILQAIQNKYHWLPPETLRRVCEKSAITPAQLAGVATFYMFFRHKPAGKHRMCVCHGTACHVKGSPQIQEAIERVLRIEPGQDTDAAREFTVEKVACVGCCTLAPVVVIDSATYGHLTPVQIGDMIEDFKATSHGGPGGSDRPVMTRPGVKPVAEIRVGIGSCCIASGSMKVRETLERQLREWGIAVSIRPVGCVGMCHRTPLVEIVYGDGAETQRVASSLAEVHVDGDTTVAVARDGSVRSVVYAKVSPEEVDRIIRRHFPAPSFLKRARARFDAAMDGLLTSDGGSLSRHELNVRDRQVTDFLGKQVHLATEACGSIDPLDLDAYLAEGGFNALRRVVTETGASATIETIKKAGLRGRGGAGFPTGLKWEIARSNAGDVKYMICNGDEGDPGAFMDRMILESYPYRVIEGMAIAAFCIGAHDGVLYIRAEYPLAVKRIREAIAQLESRNLLGPGMLEGKWPLRLTIKEGAGAFVCGEETALIASVEGQRGMPRYRPPYPAEKGLWGKPTCVNNVETLALVSWIMRNGAEAFSAHGTEKSKGTKVFALTGKVQRGGLIEVPMGITIRQIVEEIGGGAVEGRKFKAVQIGGPSGGCIPASLADTRVDYEALNAIGAIMGSGGLVVMDDSDCMVDIARFFLRFTQDQSCGKCTFCRIGTCRLLEILDRLCMGKGKPEDIPELEELCKQVKRGSLCQLGGTAPNPVLTTLKYFREEYEAHVKGRCPAGKCSALIKYVVTDTCIGCTRCAQECPVKAIPFVPYRKHEIDLKLCTRCDICRKACPVDAIKIVDNNA